VSTENLTFRLGACCRVTACFFGRATSSSSSNSSPLSEADDSSSSSSSELLAAFFRLTVPLLSLAFLARLAAGLAAACLSAGLALDAEPLSSFRLAGGAFCLAGCFCCGFGAAAAWHAPDGRQISLN